MYALAGRSQANQANLGTTHGRWCGSGRSPNRNRRSTWRGIDPDNRNRLHLLHFQKSIVFLVLQNIEEKRHGTPHQGSSHEAQRRTPGRPARVAHQLSRLIDECFAHPVAARWAGAQVGAAAQGGRGAAATHSRRGLAAPGRLGSQCPSGSEGAWSGRPATAKCRSRR